MPRTLVALPPPTSPGTVSFKHFLEFPDFSTDSLVRFVCYFPEFSLIWTLIPWISTEFCAVLSVLADLTLTRKRQSSSFFPLIFPISRMSGNPVPCIISNALMTAFATGRRPAFSSLIDWINEDFHDSSWKLKVRVSKFEKRGPPPCSWLCVLPPLC